MPDLPIYALVLLLTTPDGSSFRQIASGSPMTRFECHSTLEMVSRPGNKPRGVSYECVVSRGFW